MKATFALFIYLSAALTLAAQVNQADSARMLKSYGKLPLTFEANHGQTDPRAKFFSRGEGYSLFLTPSEAVLSLRGRATEGNSNPKNDVVVIRTQLLGANAQTELVGESPLPGKSNYFVGSDPTKWRTNVPQFGKVRYENVYPRVDLVYYGHQRELEYDFVLQPGANPNSIRLGVEGAAKLHLDHGDLVMSSTGGDLYLRAPHIYQEANGVRHIVRGQYVIKGNNEVGFRLGSYDRRRALVIDPVLAYSTYLGGSGTGGDIGVAIAVDSAGNAYVTGQTNSTDFPTANAIQPTNAGNGDAFVTKFNADGSALVYSTFLGGSTGGEEGQAIATDSAGNVYVTGATLSSDFPTVNPIQRRYGGGDTDAFVTKINADGNALVYSTYLGAAGEDDGQGIAVDSAGNAYVAGTTGSKRFPVKNSIQPAFGGGARDAFVTKINAAGSAFVYSTFLGGSDDEYGAGIAVDSAGDAYIAGSTLSADFPVNNAIQPTFGGVIDAFVTEINSAGAALVYSTYLGGSNWDQGFGIAADSAGNAYVTGVTQSTNFPTFHPIQPSLGSSNRNAFVSRINVGGTGFVFSTYLGENDDELGFGITRDSLGDAYVTGANGAPSGDTAFVTKMKADGSAVVYTTNLGGNCNSNVGSGVAVNSTDSVYMVGWTCSNNFPTTPFAFQKEFKGGGYANAFVAKVAETFANVSPATLSFPLQLIGQTSVSQKTTLTNTGTHTITINQIYFGGSNPGDFTQTNTCGSSLAAGASCTISVAFIPSTRGSRTALLGISDSDAGSPQTVSLSGTGVAVSLSAKKLNFGNQPVGTKSASQTFTLTNLDGTPLHFSKIVIKAKNAADFSQTNTCGTGIGAHASCTITVNFTPSAQGARRGSLQISDDGGASPQKVTLLGTGT
ncbi:MAG: SBBP repeat-containing protein [Acidobacteria bacterium]|nr:SBBP repeat-containing protein [Acidobacteriota bacterium]